MTNMTIQQFCDLHSACAEGRGWALANCQTMADVWGAAKPAWLIWVATRRGVLTDRELRRFAVWSARQVQHSMADPRSLAALDVAERHANGEATDEELAAADSAAYSAAEAAASAAASAAWAAYSAAEAAASAAASAALAAYSAAYSAARAAARAAAEAAASAAASAAWAADSAACSAAWAAAEAAASAAQSDWIRANTAPNFEAKEAGR